MEKPEITEGKHLSKEVVKKCEKLLTLTIALGALGMIAGILGLLLTVKLLAISGAALGVAAAWLTLRVRSLLLKEWS